METNLNPRTLFTTDQLEMLVDLFDIQLLDDELGLTVTELQSRVDVNQLVHDLAEIVLEREITMGESSVAFATLAAIHDVRAAALQAVAS